ncbi:MAG: hypothetical protein L6V88_00560 [Anaerotruncus sp.]|nr:MAG: hypothetical protein L6V88_00560 [Anaerotruncus sp.]
MVTAYDTGGNITPSGKSTLKVTIKNQSKDKKIQNIKLSASEDSGEIIINGTGTQYVQSVKAGGTYTWNLEITATKAAQAGIHKIAIASEYEDEYGTSYSASDSLPITVSQPAELDFSSAQLPASVYQGDTQTLALNLMNTGKGKISNCKIDFESDSMNSGGTVFRRRHCRRRKQKRKSKSENISRQAWQRNRHNKDLLRKRAWRKR